MLGRSALFERIRRRAAERPTADAVVSADGTALSYGALVRAVAATAALLRADGARPGEPVAVPTANTAESIVTILAVAAMEAVPLLFEANATAYERDRFMELAGAHRLVTPIVAPIVDGGSRPWPQPGSAARAEVALVTSGTNGIPKVVGKHWDAVTDNSVRFAEAAGYTGADRVLCTTPLHHAFAFGVVLVPVLFHGGTIVLAPHPPLPSALPGLLRDTGATVVQSVPFLYGAALRAAPGHRPPTLRLCVSAGEPLPQTVGAAWREAFGVPLRDQYGATELGQIAFAGQDGVLRPVPGVRVRIDGADADGEGELLVRVPGPRIRYLGQPELTGRAHADGWFRTGDWGRVEGGAVVVSSRIGRRVVVAGRKVDPAEVEGALRALDGVRDCVVAVGDEAGYVAFVVADPPHSELSLRRALAAVLSTYKIPKRLHLVPELPRTSSGKVPMGSLWRTLA
ncbi:hypothetical protein GCM10009560_45930 [Nonomuraea longicatena]|uniref:Uncharacterized protein n=1 Tax=Nonomuraea longicatena TaxID=83682 RepID=A0ABN1Q2S0_9ACTN